MVFALVTQFYIYFKCLGAHLACLNSVLNVKSSGRFQPYCELFAMVLFQLYVSSDAVAAAFVSGAALIKLASQTTKQKQEFLLQFSFIVLWPAQIMNK